MNCVVVTEELRPCTVYRHDTQITHNQAANCSASFRRLDKSIR